MKISQYIFLLAGLLFFSACSKDDDKTPPAQASFEITGSPAYPNVQITCTNTSQNSFGVEWYVDDVYRYDGNVMYLSYYNPGSHKVELKAFGTESKSSVIQWVNVKPPPTIGKITKVELISFPPSSTGSYDPGSGPDIYYTISETFGNDLYDGIANQIADVSTSDLPISWNQSPAVILGDLTEYYNIFFTDADRPSGGNHIGSFFFTPYNHLKEYSSTHILESNGLKIKLTMEWQ